MVVLASAVLAMLGAGRLAQKLSVGYDEYGFLTESHSKLRPVETNSAGVFVCGMCQAPKDIPDTVAQASAAAAKVMIMLSQPMLTRDPEIATVDEKHCVACFVCGRTCPYNAIERVEKDGRRQTAADDGRHASIRAYAWAAAPALRSVHQNALTWKDLRSNRFTHRLSVWGKV